VITVYGFSKLVGCRSEADEQADFVCWLEAKMIPHFAIPSEGERTKKFGARLKRQGWRAGTPDLIIVARAPTDGCPVAVEMKRSKGGKVTKIQMAMHEVMTRNGWHIIVAHGCDLAIKEMNALGF